VKLTEMQVLILWALIGNGGANFQKHVKPEVKARDRNALVKAGLITTEKRGQSFWLEATDMGWAWAADHLDSDLPKRSPAGCAILRAWLIRVQKFMRAREVSLAEILGPQGGGGVDTEPPTDYATLREQIRKAYLQLTGSSFNKPVLLSDLRGILKGINRSVFDETLVRMHLEKGSTLSGLDNPRDITASVRNAQVSFKGEPMYVLWITK
jgi:hypothetical protein